MGFSDGLFFPSSLPCRQMRMREREGESKFFLNFKTAVFSDWLNASRQAKGLE